MTLTDEFIKTLNDNVDFSIFREWLLEQIKELDSVEGLDDLSNEQAGEEAKVRNKAKLKLLEILDPFVNIRESKEPSTDAVNKAKKKFGV